MSTILIDQDGYKLTSYGNGCAYLLQYGDDATHVQGADASRLSDEIDAFETAWPDASRVALARFIWVTLDYGAAATPLKSGTSERGHQNVLTSSSY